MSISIFDKLKAVTTDGVIAEATQIKGGYSAVTSIIERDSLASGIKVDGTLVYVSDTKKRYIWNENTWVEDSSSQTTVPLATSEVLGGIKIGYISSNENKLPLQLDAETKQAFVEIPDAFRSVYTASQNGGLVLLDGAFSIKESGVKDEMIESVSTDKLVQGVQTLILDAGEAS